MGHRGDKPGRELMDARLACFSCEPWLSFNALPDIFHDILLSFESPGKKMAHFEALGKSSELKLATRERERSLQTSRDHGTTRIP